MSFPRANRKALLYGVQWQKLRVSLLPVHRSDGGWHTLVGTENNLDILDSYLRNVKDDVELYQVHLYRVLNLLNSTRLSNASRGRRNTTEDLLIETLQAYYKPRVVEAHIIHAANLWRWEAVENDLKTLVVTEPVTFRHIKTDLHERMEKSNRDNPKKVRANEMMHFMHLMTKVEASL